MYTIERWTARGVTSDHRATKRGANALAESYRGMRDTMQTTVIFPNGKIRVCRNTTFTGGK